MNYGNILVPVDFSSNSVQAFDFAQQLALQNNSTLHIIHIIDPFIDVGYSSNSAYRENIISMRVRNANEELKKFIDEIPHPGVNIIEVLKSGEPYEEILSYCVKQKIDLIIIASHGWTGLYHLPMGNVASKVMKYANIPVVCLKTANAIMKKDSAENKEVMAENWVG
jgi:nucleotide-binding universal stress UspA family protein